MAWTVKVDHQAFIIAQRDQQSLSCERRLDDISQSHVHSHLPDMEEAAKREMQAAPIPERSVVPGCLQDRTGTQVVYQLAIHAVRPDNPIGRKGGQRSGGEAISASNAAASSASMREAVSVASRSAGASSVEPVAAATVS